MASQAKFAKYSSAEKKQLVIVLENAQLEVAKVGKQFELLSSEKHASFLMKLKKDPTMYRPDITHQCLLMLLDSPLNKMGFLKIFIHTARNALIEVDPHVRIPRTYDRFAGLMIQLLHRQIIRASDTSQVLMKIIKNPVEQHLPLGCKKYATSCHAPKLTDVRKLVPPDDSVVIVVGAIAHGQAEPKYCEDTLKISNFPLSAALVCAKLCGAFEEVWNVDE